MHLPDQARRTIGIVSVIAAGVLTLTAAAARPDRQQADIIRGRVRGVDGSPLVAMVVATAIKDSAARSVKTRIDGTYSILFNPASGPYRMTIQAEGFADTSFTTRPDTLGRNLLVADATLRKR
jgi:hypothetical protein